MERDSLIQSLSHRKVAFQSHGRWTLNKNMSQFRCFFQYSCPQRPKVNFDKVNFDETSKQLIGETQVPLPVQPGQPARYDSAYQRNGTRKLFLFCEPQAGWRHVEVTQTRTMQDFAQQMQWLVDERYPEATGVRVVLGTGQPEYA